MAPAPLTLTFRLYQAFSTVAAPLALRTARRRFVARQGPMNRFAERNGHASKQRPRGKLIWLHTVSVGEFLSVLDLVRDLAAAGAQLLVTTTTSSAADLANQRLPDGVIHQFAPIDTPMAVGRFLDHWRPDLVAFVESEIWPNQIVMAHKCGMPLALINARLSASSLKTWKKLSKTARALLTRFSRIMTQTDSTRLALERLGAPAECLETTGDMKAAAATLPFDATTAEAIAKSIKGRPIWVASSTHDGEEPVISTAHRLAMSEHPSALLILVPRHPERGDQIKALLQNEGWAVARRSNGDPITASTQIYLADTLGETGLWYHLSPIVFVAGSFTRVGGHNPYEPAHFNCAILHGPHYANFTLAYEEMAAVRACVEVEDATALGLTVAKLISNTDQKTLSKNALTYIQNAGNNRTKVAGTLLSLMN